MATKVIDATLATGASTDAMGIEGITEIFISGLTAGSIQAEVRFKGDATWYAMPDGLFEEDTWKSMEVFEEGVMMRLTGVANNADVYVRISKNIY